MGMGCSPWEWDDLHHKGMLSEQCRAPAPITPRPKQTLVFPPPCRGTSPPHLTSAFQHAGAWKATFPILMEKTPFSPTSSTIFPVRSKLLLLVVLFSCRKEQVNLCHLEIPFAFLPPDGNSLVSAITKHTTKSRYDLLTYSK